MQNQLYAFAIFILNGLLIGILFDIFRISRKVIKTPNIITYGQDIIFWLISGLMLIYSIFKFNNGEIRLYIFIGVCIGILTYMLIFSKLFINVSVDVINFIKKIIQIVIIKPIKFLFQILNKIIIKPIIYILQKIKTFFKRKKSFSKIKSPKILFKNRIYKNKKDFA